MHTKVSEWTTWLSYLCAQLHCPAQDVPLHCDSRHHTHPPLFHLVALCFKCYSEDQEQLNTRRSQMPTCGFCYWVYKLHQFLPLALTSMHTFAPQACTKSCSLIYKSPIFRGSQKNLISQTEPMILPIVSLIMVMSNATPYDGTVIQ